MLCALKIILTFIKALICHMYLDKKKKDCFENICELFPPPPLNLLCKAFHKKPKGKEHVNLLKSWGKKSWGKKY